jgi:ketosteroid isomerase-like protein
MRRVLFLLLSSALVAAGGSLAAQNTLDPLGRPAPAANPLSDFSQTPGTTLLFQLEAKFAKDTAAGGGKAFAAYFAPDAVTLSNGEIPVKGHDAIAARATWLPADYQLTWTPLGGQMNAGGDMGFTWGHYDGKGKDKNGQIVTDSGRYMTIWRKQADGSWKVELDSSNNEPAAAADCCKLQ